MYVVDMISGHIVLERVFEVIQLSVNSTHGQRQSLLIAHEFCGVTADFVSFYRRNCHVPEEFNDLSMVVTVSTVGGVFFGGLIGSRQMADKFIMLNQHSKFSSVMQAQVSKGQVGGADENFFNSVAILPWYLLPIFVVSLYQFLWYNQFFLVSLTKVGISHLFLQSYDCI